MKKSTRVLCLVIAAAFVVTLLFSIVMSIAYAEEGGEAASRGETVYVTADANGNVESVISSVYLSNTARLDTLTDYTSLTDVKAITTNEPPVVNGDAVTFAAGEGDVSYQGTASADALPFSVRIAYYLNGREIAPEKLAGKSGRVRIEIAAENRLKRTADVDGETVELYVPFSIIGMLTLGEGFSGVTAENAKVSVQAGQITVLAVLLPGLAESLGMEPGDKINDTLTIEATVENFSFSGGNNGSDKFRKACTHGNNGKSDQCLAESQADCNRRGSIDDKITAVLDRDHTSKNENETFPCRKEIDM